jgi:Ca-activated chloride channel family protein
MIPGPTQVARFVVFACLPVLCPISLSLRVEDPASVSAQVTLDRRVKRGPSTPPALDPTATLRVDVPLVLVPVHVSTLLGAPVTNLDKGDFRVLEDNVEQTISHFSKEDAPLSVGLLLDASGSMRDKMRKSSEAAGQFLRTSNSEDEFFLIEFNERPTLSLAFTQNAAEIQKRILHAKALGRTSLLDAVHLALSQMKKAQNARKALVILSDGGDNHSRYTEGEIKRAVRESDVQVYAMAILDPDVSAKPAPEERNGPRLLDELARESGGGYFQIGNLDELPGICARIGTELRNQYILGYSPINTARDGKYRRLKVTLATPEATRPLNVHHRLGYYAPAQ